MFEPTDTAVVATNEGSLNPLVAVPVFAGSLIETHAYSAQLKVSLDEIKASSDKLREVTPPVTTNVMLLRCVVLCCVVLTEVVCYVYVL
jgi:hypothetical protein